MVLRALFAVTLATLLALVGQQTQPQTLSAGRNGGTGATPLQALLNTMRSGQWKKLNAANGNGIVYNLLSSYGFTIANFDGASNDPWASNAAVAATAALGYPGSGVNPGDNAGVFAYSAAAIRPSDGKVVAIGTGGHAASILSSVFTFDSQAAAATCNPTCSGIWSMPIKPARFIHGWDDIPRGSVQSYRMICTASWSGSQASEASISVTGCQDSSGNSSSNPGPFPYLMDSDSGGCISSGSRVNTASTKISEGSGTIKIFGTTSCSGSNIRLRIATEFWIATNPDGIWLPVSCHTYRGNIFLSGTKWSSSGGACNVPADAARGAAWQYDDSTNSLTTTISRIASVANGFDTANPGDQIAPGFAYNDLDGDIYVGVGSGGFRVWANPTTSPTASGRGSAPPYIGVGFFKQAIIFSDPGNPSKRWFFQHMGDRGSDDDCKSHAPSNACFNLWQDIGGSPTGNIYNYSGTFLGDAGNYTVRGWCYHKGIGKPLYSNGGQHIYQVNTTTDPANSPWTVSEFTTSISGDTVPMGTGGNLVSLGCLAPTYNAELLVIDSNVYIHKD